MKAFLSAATVGLFAALTVLFLDGCDPAATRAATPISVVGTTRPVAVVELFTSEGCSSCPPADDALADLVKDSRKDGSLVFPLSFHVDYWNRLGWKDRFSDAGFSARQRAYAKVLGDQDVYTPQAVVNGRVGFVGSDREKLKQETAAALKTPSVATVGLKITPDTEGRKIVVEYQLKDAPTGGTFNVAAVERDLQTKVDAGENGGRTLKHSNVVRAFETRTLDGSNSTGTVTLKVPDDLAFKNVAVIGYVQDAKTMAILGASAGNAIPGP